jgi:hypothetical protein
MSFLLFSHKNIPLFVLYIQINSCTFVQFNITLFDKMAKTVERYIFDDFITPENNCIVSTMVQLSDKCGLSASALQKIFSDRNMYYDNSGKFKIEKRKHYIATSKSRIK